MRLLYGVLLAFAFGASAEVERLPGESYSDYAERYKDHLDAVSSRSRTAAGDSGKAVRREIVSRCRDQMGKYGSAMVKSCADQDIEAYAELADMQQRYPEIVDRCLRQMKRYGYNMVRSCAEQDIEAERELSGY